MIEKKQYTPGLADEICERLSNGESLRAMCRDEHMPARMTILRWVQSDREGFAARYAVARDAGLDMLADETLEIADTLQEGTQTREGPKGKEVTRRDLTEHRRLQVDARKWYLSKLAPKRYGDKSSVELSGTLAVSNMTEAEIRAELAALIASGVLSNGSFDADISDLL